jgi:hypothetical protein
MGSREQGRAGQGGHSKWRERGVSPEHANICGASMHKRTRTHAHTHTSAHAHKRSSAQAHTCSRCGLSSSPADIARKCMIQMQFTPMHQDAANTLNKEEPFLEVCCPAMASFVIKVSMNWMAVKDPVMAMNSDRAWVGAVNSRVGVDEAAARGACVCMVHACSFTWVQTAHIRGGGRGCRGLVRCSSNKQLKMCHQRQQRRLPTHGTHPPPNPESTPTPTTTD